jgi:hypothetical protein
MIIYPIKIKALDYTSNVSGQNIIYSKPEQPSEQLYYTNLSINIENIENIGSFDVLVKYDKQYVGLSNCHLLNYIGSPCYISGSSMYVYYSYKANNTDASSLRDYNLYTVTFMPKDTTPKTGTTTVTVEFENAKDSAGNPIYISPSTKTYTFMDMKYAFTNSPNQNSSADNDEVAEGSGNSKFSDNNKNGTSNIIKSNDDVNDKEESNNNYLNNLEISGGKYNINFKKDVLDYYITVADDIESPNVIALAEDSKATIKIDGNDDLKNHNTITVKVIAQSGDIRKYYIHIKHSQYAMTKSNDDKEKVSGFIIIMLVIGLFIVTLISLFIVPRVGKKHKINSDWGKF